MKTREELVDLIYDLHLQNTDGRETPDEMFRLGIEACLEELVDFSGGEMDFEECYNSILEGD